MGISIDAFWETFQFTPLREGRRVWRKQRRSRPDFNSRPSARGDDSGDAVQIYDLISIHAPPRGATGHEERIGGLRDDFNSRPSARGDTLVEKVKKLPDISIHAPPRGATHCLCFLRPQYSFQFTPLREGRPDCAGTRRLRKRISIHAPPRGATVHGVCWGYWNLISIHAPPRGATATAFFAPVVLDAFQFTPLREGRQVGESCFATFGVFQFTPLREGRLYSAVTLLSRCYFNSRPSARGDMPTEDNAVATPIFQFTPLREGRRADSSAAL